MTAPPPPWGQQPSQYGQPWRPPVDPTDPLVSTDYAGWWRRGTDLARRCWRQLLVLQLIGAAVTFAFSVPASYFRLRQSAEQLRALEEGSSPPNPFAGLLPAALTLLAALPTIVVFAAIALAGVHVVVTTGAGGTPSVGGALRGATRRLGPMIGWSFLAGLAVLLGVCFCVLPAFYLGAVFVMLPAVVALERDEPISRCFRLFHGDVGAAAGRAATLLGITFGVSGVAAIVGALSQALIGSSTSTGFLVGSAVGTTLLSVLLGALVALLTVPLVVVTYADLRARREPLSTPQLAAELAR